MNPSDAALLLAFCAAFDQRTVGEADARAWSEALGLIKVDDAREAVVGHYRDETRRVMPADVIKRVRSIRAARINGRTPPTPPSELAEFPQAETRWKRVYMGVLANGGSEDDAHRAACGVLNLDPDAVLGGPITAAGSLNEAIKDAEKSMRSE
jgi:hypothetical protein